MFYFFLFIRKCSCVLDSQNFDSLKESIAADVESNFPADSRLAVMLFATDTRLAFNFDSKTNAELAAQIRALTWFGGSAWADVAMRNAKSSVFDPAKAKGRDQVIRVCSTHSKLDTYLCFRL